MLAPVACFAGGMGWPQLRVLASAGARWLASTSACGSLAATQPPDTCSRAGALVRTGSAAHPAVRAFASVSTGPTRPTAEVGRLNHVAIAVPDLTRAAARYREVLGAKVSAPQALPEHGVTVVFVELPNTKIELLEPLGDASPISSFLQRNPAGGIHHLCLEVADVRRSLAALHGSVRALNAEPKTGAHGNPVVFLHPKDNDGVLTELEEVGAAA